MARFIIQGGKKLEGEITLAGNKNSALKLIPATLLGNSSTTLTNVPQISDVEVMVEILNSLGAKAVLKGSTLTVDPQGLKSYDPDPLLCAKLRASVVLAAPLLAKFGRAVVTPPGGDQIGDRLLDTHFTMMQKLGVEIKRKDGRFHLQWKNKPSNSKETKIFLEESSVTATEMGMMMASSILSDIEISDAAAEPHITDLGLMLLSMGVKISGLGTNSLNIHGGELSGTNHKVMPDHIEGGTFAIASAITNGHVIINDFRSQDYEMALHYFKNMGMQFKVYDNKLEVLPAKLIAIRRKFQTRTWPGFPTDLMSPFIVLATQTEGTILCHDWMYEWRMFFVDDLISMGANIFIADPHRVIISGKTQLMSDRLFCKDIRAGISVVLAAMVAEGESIIENAEVVRRGYQNLESRLSVLGASIKKID